MQPRERILTALKGGIPDRVPVIEFLFSLKLQKEVMGYNTILYEGETQVKMAAKMGIDAAWLPINGFCGIEEVPHEQDEIYKDEWGVTYKKNGWPIIAQIETPVKSREDWEQYKMPEVATAYRTKIIREGSKANDENIAVIAGLLGPFTMASWYIMDINTLSESLFLDPDLVHEITDAYVNWALAAAKLAVKDGNIDGFIISDDWGGTTNLLISPEHFREFFMEPYRKLVQGLKALGVPVIMHNDGNIRDVLDDLVNTGISGYHPVEKAAGMDLKEVKETYMNRICPIGNVNNKTTMVLGSPQDVINEAIDCIKTGAPGGGYIFSTDHSLHDDIPFENVFALLDTVRKYGNYPLKF